MTFGTRFNGISLADAKDWTTFFELAGPGDTTIFAVRGTQSPLDVMQDLNIFTPVAVTQIAAYFGPDLTSSVTRTVFQVFSGLPSIDKDFYEVLLSHVRQRAARRRPSLLRFLLKLPRDISNN